MAFILTGQYYPRFYSSKQSDSRVSSGIGSSNEKTGSLAYFHSHPGHLVLIVLAG